MRTLVSASSSSLQHFFAHLSSFLLHFTWLSQNTASFSWTLRDGKAICVLACQQLFLHLCYTYSAEPPLTASLCMSLTRLTLTATVHTDCAHSLPVTAFKLCSLCATARLSAAASSDGLPGAMTLHQRPRSNLQPPCALWQGSPLPSKCPLVPIQTTCAPHPDQQPDPPGHTALPPRPDTFHVDTMRPGRGRPRPQKRPSRTLRTRKEIGPTTADTPMRASAARPLRAPPRDFSACLE